MNKKELRIFFENFCKGSNFTLNQDEKMVEQLLDGILNNEKDSGLKYCPCQLRDGNFEKDLELICPCNFFSHDTWLSGGRCWCGLFVKRKIK